METNFLRDYREFTSGNEAHPTYHLFTSLVALSSIISRRVWLDMEYFTIFPNLYVVLVGPPGNRKTSAMSTGKALLRELKEIPFSGECISKEKLVLDMTEQERGIMDLPDKYAKMRLYSPMTVMVTELSEFLSISAAGMIGFLTDVYDQEFYEHKTKNKGTSVITGPFLNVLACTTPEWITTYLRSDIISGGFSRRTLFVNETEKSARIAFPTITPAMSSAWGRVLQHSRILLKVRGPFLWSPEAREYYTKWYIAYSPPSDESLVGYYETKHIQMLKLAMLVALSDDPTKLVLEVRHIEVALSFLSLVESNLAKVFEAMGRNDLNRIASKTLDVIRRSPSIEYTDLQGHKQQGILIQLKKLEQIMFRECDKNEWTMVIEHLKQSGRIETMSFTTQGVPREFVRLIT